VPRVHGREQPGGALPFTTIAVTTAPAAVALAAIAITTIDRLPSAVALAASVAGLDLLQAGIGDSDNELLVSKLQWGRDVLAYRVRVQVPRVHCSRVHTGGGALPFTITASCFHGPHSHKLHDRR